MSGHEEGCINGWGKDDHLRATSRSPSSSSTGSAAPPPSVSVSFPPPSGPFVSPPLSSLSCVSFSRSSPLERGAGLHASCFSPSSHIILNQEMKTGGRDETKQKETLMPSQLTELKIYICWHRIEWRRVQNYMVETWYQVKKLLKFEHSCSILVAWS